MSTTQQATKRITALTEEISHCRACADYLQPRPVVRLGAMAKLLIIGQAPGTKVHASGIPWNDASGRRLRCWLELTEAQFYDTRKVAIMPMGFCYPGKGLSGDLPPRPECQPLWHDKVLSGLVNIQLTLLIGQYAQRAYLQKPLKTLSENVSAWQRWFPEFVPLPHPSPRNQYWLQERPWFENELLPVIRQQVHKVLRE